MCEPQVSISAHGDKGDEDWLVRITCSLFSTGVSKQHDPSLTFSLQLSRPMSTLFLFRKKQYQLGKKITT
jgi:hypothetical protein